MNERIYNLIDELNKWGWGNESWGLVDCGNGVSTGHLFGVNEDRIITGRILYLYAKVDEEYEYLKEVHDWWSLILTPEEHEGDRLFVYSLK